VAQLTNLAVHGLNRPEHLEWALKGPGADLLAWAKDEGLVGQVGFSSHGTPELIEAALSSGSFTFCSLHVHLFDQTRLAIARAALSEGIGVLAISPADKGGRLYDPPAELLADCAPFDPLELAYRFLLDQGISTFEPGG
jgi:Predicted oxidoreductases of the aldo/keto reductase family